MVVQPIWNTVLEPGDQMIHDAIGYHVIHWPDYVIDDCYACDVTEKIVRIQHDFTYTIPHLFDEPRTIFDKAGRDFVQLFKDDVDDHVADDPWSGDLYHILHMDPQTAKDQVISAYHEKAAEVQGDIRNTMVLNAAYKAWEATQTFDVTPAPPKAGSTTYSFLGGSSSGSSSGSGSWFGSSAGSGSAPNNPPPDNTQQKSDADALYAQLARLQQEAADAADKARALRQEL